MKNSCGGFGNMKSYESLEPSNSAFSLVNSKSRTKSCNSAGPKRCGELSASGTYMSPSPVSVSLVDSSETKNGIAFLLPFIQADSIKLQGAQHTCGAHSLSWSPNLQSE